jgi:DNA polymerase-3 subunit gamma/tau
MAEALYRKYRPNTFADVAEQGHVVRTVENQLKLGKVAHAYLFAGPRGVGKTTIARLLAKALNCENRKAGESEPCNACQSCLEMREGRFMDVVEIDAASQSKVEETRENIIESVRFGPSRGKFKVFIIDEVHMLSTASFNALLKTLEEPPAHAVFILATTELHKIPATIISRCQRFDFHRIPVKEMMERLEKISKKENKEVDEKVLASISRLSEGCLRDAESLLGQLFSLGEDKIGVNEASLVLPATHLDMIGKIANAVGRKEVQEALKLLNELVENGGSVKHALDEMLEYVRSMMFASLGSVQADDYDPASLKDLEATAKLSSASEHRRFLDLLLTARSRQSVGAYPQIPFEIALVEACLGPSAVPASSPAPSAPQPAVSRPTQPPPATPLKGGGSTPPPAPRAPYVPDSGDLPPSVVHKTTVAKVPEPMLENPDSPTVLTFTVAELQDKWGRCCSYVAERNVALPLVLNAAKPVSIVGGKVTISFAYQFHMKAMQEVKNQRLLAEAIGAVMMGTPTEFECITEKTEAPAENSVDAFVEALGGNIA